MEEDPVVILFKVGNVYRSKINPDIRITIDKIEGNRIFYSSQEFKNKQWSDNYFSFSEWWIPVYTVEGFEV